VVLLCEVLRHAATDLGEGTAHDPAEVPLVTQKTLAFGPGEKATKKKKKRKKKREEIRKKSWRRATGMSVCCILPGILY
jgi:hypothetical protein